MVAEHLRGDHPAEGSGHGDLQQGHGGGAKARNAAPRAISEGRGLDDLTPALGRQALRELLHDVGEPAAAPVALRVAQRSHPLSEHLAAVSGESPGRSGA